MVRQCGIPISVAFLSLYHHLGAEHLQEGISLHKSVATISGDMKGEIARKGIHLCTGILMVVLYALYERNVLVFIHLFFLVAIWLLELLRVKGAIKVPFLRARERKVVGAHAFFMLSTFISILIFDMRIAIASILMLTIGDPASGAVQLCMRDSLGSIEGREAVLKPPIVILIMFLVSFLVGYLSLGSMRIAIFGALGAAVADGLMVKVRDVSIDDNLTIPLYAGLLMSLASMW
jgi:dolichol kinase